MSGRWPFTAEKIATRLELIEPYIFRRRQPLPNFRLLPLSDAVVDAPICADPSAWQEIPHESYWGGANLNFVLKSHFTVPDDWDADQLALHLPLGVLGDIFNHPEALLHIDAVPIASADRYHHTIPLDRSLKDARRHVLSLHGWTGHVGWPPDTASKAKLFMGKPELVERDPALLSFFGLARAALDAAKVQDRESSTSQAILRALDTAFLVLDTRDPIGEAFYASVEPALDCLRSSLTNAGAPLDVTLNGIGHAHMDIAYLWPISQMRLKNARTYSNVLRLMETDDDFKFSHSQPQLYAYTADDYPALFEGIKKRVAEGRWEVIGGMWVEPDLNIPGPEALVRQLMLGRDYFRDTFGDVETPVLWLPDTFGFPGQLPQMMKHAGLKWFVTNKLNWNQYNKIPSSSHHWQGIDGTRVLAHVLTTPRPVQYLPFPTNYKSDLSASEVLGTWENSTARDQVRDLPICYGYGDGGGGPTEELLAKAHAFAGMPGMPKFRMSTVREALEAIEASSDELPVWHGEHYMEGHRGVLTSQAWIKRANRKAEWALHEAEALACMAGTRPDLNEAWQLLCLNQFHDIITGTSVPHVFVDARRDFDRIMEIADDAAKEASERLGQNQVGVANMSPVSGPRQVVIPEANLPNSQQIDDGSLLYFANLPSYSMTSIDRASFPDNPCTCVVVDDGAVLENAVLRVRIDGNGQLSEVYDKTANRSVLAPGHNANLLQAFEDRPICWDAWDIDPSFEDRMEIIDSQCTLEIIETGPLRASLRISRRWRNSTIVQTVRLMAHSPRIDFDTEIDWHETHTLLKAAFPTAIDSPVAQFDIQWGIIERSTRRDSAFDAARFEVPAQKWAKLSDDDYAIAVLNDCKYGYDIRDNTIRLTLTKSSTYPDPNADQGEHVFTYSLLPIAGADQAVLNQQAYDLNTPLRVISPSTSRPLDRPPLIISSNPAVIVETVKPAKDPHGIIIRMFEANGQPTDTTLTFAPHPRQITIVDFLEQPLRELPMPGTDIKLDVDAFEIVSLRVFF